MELELREVEIRAVSEDRTVSGLAVPYNQVTTVSGYKERIERGAFAEVSDNVTLFYGHDHRTGGLPIGKVVEARETEDGLEIKAAIAKTPKGDEVYTLLREGVLNKFSIGFLPIESKKDGDVVVRTKGDLKEVSIVAIPAYANAAVSEVRSDADNPTNKEEVNMSIDNVDAPEVAEIREAVSDLERKFALLSEQGNATDTVSTKYRHGGEALKGLLAGEEEAKTLFRAFTGATSADTNAQPAWVNKTIQLVEENRDVLNLFSREAHPGTTSVTLPVLGSTTGTTTGLQSAEGADLQYVEVLYTDKTFNNQTYGNYASLSRQAIELGTPGYLAKVLEFQATQYAKDTNKAVRSAIAGATGTATATLSADSFVGWADLVVDAASTLANNGSGLSAEFMVVSTDVFKRVAHLSDTAGRPLMTVNGDGSNTVGTANLRALRGSILGMPVVVDAGAPANTCYITNSQAVTVMESSGAPVRLADENIINLTKDFSLYGYLIVGVTNPLAIVKVDADPA